MILTKHSYCPKCFNTTLELKNSGKVNLFFDGKKKESSVFLYNLTNDTQEEINQQLVIKLRDFFKWYGSFEHRQPIKKVEAISPDFVCTDGCSLDPNFQPSVVGILFDQKFFENTVSEIAETCGVELD
tara:strand:- start:87 stop:470 length:384 start_codon:yes stop_codon:yes gene_type:complete